MSTRDLSPPALVDVSFVTDILVLYVENCGGRQASGGVRFGRYIDLESHVP